MKLKMINDSKHGIVVVQEDTNCLLDHVKSVSMDTIPNEGTTMTIVLYIPKEDATVKNEDID